MQTPDNSLSVFIDYTEVASYMISFLYKVHEVPPEVPYASSEPVKNSYMYINSYILACMCSYPDELEVIQTLQSLDILEGMSVSDKVRFTKHLDEFLLTILVTYRYLRVYINVGTEYIYRTQYITEYILVVTMFKLSREANELVYTS